jgi:hypothetical protein
VTITGQDLRVAARDAVVAWRDLVRLSRPATWVWTGLPYLAGALDAQRGLDAAVVLGTIYFLGPYNLLRHGVAALIGDDGRPTDQALSTSIAIAVTNVPVLLALAYLGGPAGTLALVLAVGLATVPGVPAVRTHRHWPDAQPLVGATVLVVAAACGQLVCGLAVGALPWVTLGAAWLWAAASLVVSGGIPALGVRPQAGLALAAYAAAVALVATHGILGVLAAAGLALYLALPAMVLLAGRDGAAITAAVGRARGDGPGLHVLVGTWLAILLLRYWGLTPYSAWEAAIVVATALTGYVLASIVTTYAVTRRHQARETADDSPVPSVTIVVPCHDDAERLPACLAAIRSQTYADITVVVVDDGSTDGSTDEAAAWLGEDAVLIAPPRPAAWGGRDWARHVGATAADTDLLLFVDADTVLVPVATRVLVEDQQFSGADLLSGLTRFETRTIGEQAAVPGFPLVLFGLVPVWWSALTGGRPAPLAFATASPLLVRREAYLAVDAHWGPPTDAGPGGRLDLGLAQAFVRADLAVRTVQAVDLGVSRRHRDVAEAVAGWRRSAVPPMPGGLAIAVATILVEVVAFLVPLALPIAALIAGQPPALVGAASAPLGLLLLARIALVLTQRHPPITIAWHPVTILLALAGQAAGLADHVAGQAPPGRGAGVSTPGSAAAGTSG